MNKTYRVAGHTFQVCSEQLCKAVEQIVGFRPFECEEGEPLDVVLFRYRGKHVLHRIIRREGECLLIQGDGSIVAKEECTVDDVVGKVVQICRPSGKEIPVGSWQWTIPSRVWRGLGFLRIWLLRVAYRLFLRPVK